MAHEQQPAAEEDRREEPILGFADTVSQHPDEPEERDPRERHENEREQDRVTARAVRQPLPCVTRI